MKRFYKQVDISPERGILLDGKPVRTPKRAMLILPNDKLARAVAAEWAGQGDELDARSMTATGLANAAIDIITPDPVGFGAGIAAYGESDVLCYRATEPPELVAKQDVAWDPMIEWARRRFDVRFLLVSGIMHMPQPASTVERLAREVAKLSPYQLAALSPLVTISGSLVTGLALIERSISPERAFDACHVDEIWQSEKWGEDRFATQTRDAHRAEFMAAAAFLRLLG